MPMFQSQRLGNTWEHSWKHTKHTNKRIMVTKEWATDRATILRKKTRLRLVTLYAWLNTTDHFLFCIVNVKMIDFQVLKTCLDQIFKILDNKIIKDNIPYKLWALYIGKTNMLTQHKFGTKGSFKKKWVNESSYILSNYVHNLKMQYIFLSV